MKKKVWGPNLKKILYYDSKMYEKEGYARTRSNQIVYEKNNRKSEINRPKNVSHMKYKNGIFTNLRTNNLASKSFTVYD